MVKQHILIQKINSLPGKPNGVSPTGDILKGYRVEGVCTNKPTVGQHFQLLRYKRNDVEAIGVFTTSEVTAVWPEKDSVVFQTKNSVYKATPQT